MKLLAALIVVLVIVVGILGPQLFFVVDETQMGLLTRFGEPRRSMTQPGLYMKVPFMETVTYFDKRLLIFDAPPDSLLTQDKKRLIIDVYARGRIVDPLKFYITVGTEAQAASTVGGILTSELRREIGLDDQIEIIRESREAITNRVRDAVAPKLEEFGIKVVDVRIKRTDFPETIAESVYARMQAERKRIADRERAEGEERDAEIRANVDREAAIIRAEAQRDANIIRGAGEAEAIRIFAEALRQDPEFYAFQRSLKAYRIFLADNTTVVLPANSDLFQFLQTPRGNGQSHGVNGANGGPASPAVSNEFVAQAYLARTLGAETSELRLMGSEPANWPDASLGCPKPGEVYAPVIVPGLRMVFDHKGQQIEVHTNADASHIAMCES
jgi:membrane protease subunit HflC